MHLKNTLKHLSNTLLATLLIFATSSVFAEGTNMADTVSGYVTATSPEGDIRRLNSGDELKEGDTITTGEKSSVSITFADGTVVEISELSSYVVDFKNDDQLTADTTQSKFAPRSIGRSSPSLSTGTSAGGGGSDNNGAPTTPTPGGSPSN